MRKLKQFVNSAVIGGLVVVLPLAIFLFALAWIFGLVRAGIRPISTVVTQNWPLTGLVVDLVVVLLLIAVCFSLGVLVRTRLGKWLYGFVEGRLLLKAPGYSLVKETVAQFLGNKKSPFSSVALVQIFGDETMVSALVTDEHEYGYTVFVPTGPNPTSGNIYHLPARHVHKVDASIEEAMRTIISCGAGSASLLQKAQSTPPK